MVTVLRGVDQQVLIGEEIFVGPTDIDEKTVRVVARGRMMGGPNDGGTFQSVHELSRGQSFSIGPCIVVSLVEIKGQAARFSVRAPRHLGVCKKESIQKAKGNDIGCCPRQRCFAKREFAGGSASD